MLEEVQPTLEEPQDEFVVSLEDGNTSIRPSSETAAERADKFNYTLGVDSPGKAEIARLLDAGEEPKIRQFMAEKEGMELDRLRWNMIQFIGQQRGRELSVEEGDFVRGLTAVQLRTNPMEILEQKFAEKYIDDVSRLQRYEYDRDLLPKFSEEQDWAIQTAKEREFFYNQWKDREDKWQQTGWVEAIPTFIADVLPIRPWLMQEWALSQRPGFEPRLGETMDKNIRYLWALPFNERVTQFNEAMTWFETYGSKTDARMFAQGMISFPLSEQYLGNLVSAADWIGIGAPIARLLQGIAKRAQPLRTILSEPVTPEAAPPRPTYEGPASRWTDPRLTPERQVEEQLDMFGPQPDQGSFRFMDRPEQLRPLRDDETPGKLRATHVPYAGRAGSGEGTKSFEGPYRDSSGRMRRKSEELSLPLDTPVHQGNFDLVPPSVQKFSKAMADGLKAMEGKQTVEGTASAIGEVEIAGQIGALRVLEQRITGSLPELAREVPTFANPFGFWESSKVMGREAARKIALEVERRGGDLLTTFADAIRVQRLTPEAVSMLQSITGQALRNRYPHLNDSVLDVLPVLDETANITGTELRLGKSDGTVFSTKEEATFYKDNVYKLGSEAYVADLGHSHYIGIRGWGDETNPFVRDMNVDPKGPNQTPSNWVNTLLRKFRSTEYLLSQFQSSQRRSVVFGPAEVRAMVKEMVDADLAIKGGEAKELWDILRYSRDAPQPGKPTERGIRYNTAAALEQAWVDRFGHTPSEKQLRAYDTYQRLMDFDLFMRNVIQYRDKARKGTEQFRFKVNEGYSPWFEGIEIPDGPWRVGNAIYNDAGILIHDSKTGNQRYRYLATMTEREKKDITDLLQNQGYKTIQIFEPRKHPLEGITKTAEGDDLKDVVHYVITDAWDRKALSLRQVENHPGGHSIYPHEFWVSQADIRKGRSGKNTYFGDRVALNATSHAEAVKWSGLMDEARILGRAQKWAEMDAFLRAKLPFYTSDDFKNLFNRKDSPFDWDLPIVVKTSGKNTLDDGNELKSRFTDLVDATKDPHDPSNTLDKSFLADRDLVIKGVDEQTMRLVDAEQLDPYLSFQKAFGQNLRNFWMTDYKTGAVEQWMREFSEVLKPSDDTLGAHPTFFLFNPQYRNISPAQYPVKAAAETSRQAIVNLLFGQNELSSAVNWLRLKAQDKAYATDGQKAAALYNTEVGLTAFNNPVSFMRALAYHTKLGMGAIDQYFVQGQAAVNSMTIAGPIHGWRGFTAYLPVIATYYNPKMFDSMSNIAVKLGGWNKKDFAEMHDLFKRSGSRRVGQELSMRESLDDGRIVQTTTGKILEKGAFAFTEGERVNRIVSFAAAYSEMKAKNPGMKFGQRERQALMDRADLMNFNMTRASNASWQNGLVSLPTQFMTYNARLMEELLGGRLTKAEKARVIGVNSLLYGIPAGVGGAVGVLPVVDYVKQKLAENGIQTSEGWERVATNGLLDYLAYMVTGRNYNVPERMGPGNNTFFRDVLGQDKKWSEILLGASGSILGDLVEASAPFEHAVSGLFTGQRYPMKADDWITLARNISSFDRGYKAYVASVYGKWVTRQGASTFNDANGVDAFMGVLFGLSPKEATEAFMGVRSLKEQGEYQRKIGNEAIKEIKRALEAGAAGDQPGMHDYLDRAYRHIEAADLTLSQKNELFHRARTENEALADRIPREFWRRAPASQQQKRLENYLRNQ